MKDKIQNQQAANTRSRIADICKNCTHGQFDPQRGIICGLTNDCGDFHDDCESFEPNESYIARKCEDREKSQKDETADSSIFFFAIVPTYLFCLISMLIGGDTPATTIWVLLAVGVTLAGAGFAYYMYNRSRQKRVAFGRLNEKNIMSILRDEGYRPEKIDDGIMFKVSGYNYHLRYNDSRFILRSSWLFENRDVELMRAIAAQIGNEILIAKVFVSDYDEEDRGVSVIVSIEALMSYEVELREQLPQFVNIIDASINHFATQLNDICDNQNREQEDASARRQSVYYPEYGWLAEMVDAVRDGKLAPEALSDEAWLKQGFLHWCEPSMIKIWDEFKIIRVDKYGDYKLIVYRFPEPKAVPEAVYGAVLLNVSTKEAVYYTLEYSYNGKWVLGATDNGKHANYGEAETNDLEKFIDWIFDSNKQLHHYTDMYRYDNDVVS